MWFWICSMMTKYTVYQVTICTRPAVKKEEEKIRKEAHNWHSGSNYIKMKQHDLNIMFSFYEVKQTDKNTSLSSGRGRIAKPWQVLS